MTLGDLRALLQARSGEWACIASRGPEYEAAAVFFRRRFGEVLLYSATATAHGVRFFYSRNGAKPKYMELET